MDELLVRIGAQNMIRLTKPSVEPELMMDVQALLRNQEVHFKTELYMVGAWTHLGYDNAELFMADSQDSIVDRLAAYFSQV